MLSPNSDFTLLRLVWLSLAMIGAAIALLTGDVFWRATSASGFIAQIALALWCLVETLVRRNWVALWTLPALTLGLGCALPLYLFIRSRRIT